MPDTPESRTPEQIRAIADALLRNAKLGGIIHPNQVSLYVAALLALAEKREQAK